MVPVIKLEFDRSVDTLAQPTASQDGNSGWKL
jgi:hypothetical protein